jgi:hypothetical protein
MRLVQVDQSLSLLPSEDEEEPDEKGLEDLSLVSLSNTPPLRVQRKLYRPRGLFPEGTEEQRAERALQLKAKGWGKAKIKIILEIWGVTKGGSPKYKAAEAEYKRLVGE